MYRSRLNVNENSLRWPDDVLEALHTRIRLSGVFVLKQLLFILFFYKIHLILMFTIFPQDFFLICLVLVKGRIHQITDVEHENRTLKRRIESEKT